MTTVFVATAALVGCDTYARLAPDALKYAAPPIAEAEPEPDVRQIVKDNLPKLFMAQSAPKNVAVSRAERRSGHWTACMRASVTGLTHAQVGVQTFALVFERGKILTRERTDKMHPCATETFEPI